MVIPADDGMNAAVDAGPGGEVLPYLPERDGGQAQPLFREGVPARRLRSKTAPPPAIATMSMLHIEGEKRILAKFGSVFEFALPPDNDVASEGSWTLETTLSPAQQHPPQEQQEVHDAPLPGHDDEKDGDGGQTETDEVHDQKEEESDVEEDLGEAPNSRDGGSSSAASNVSRNVLVRMSKIQALQTIHDNVSDYIAEEICKIDGTFPEQMWCIPELNKALVRKVEVEEQIQLLADEDQAEEQQQLTHEFLRPPKRSATKRFVKTLPTRLSPSRPSMSSLSSTKRLSNQCQEWNSKKWLKGRTKLWRSCQQRWFTQEKLYQEHIAPEQWCVETTRHQMTTTRTLEVLMQHRSEQC